MATRGSRGKGPQASGPSVEELRSILPNLSQAAVKSLRRRLEAAAHRAQDYSPAHVEADVQPLKVVRAKSRTLSTDLKVLEKAMAKAPPLLQSTANVMLFYEGLDLPRWLKGLSTLRLTVERLAQLPTHKHGRREDLQGTAVALFVADALAAEGVEVLGPSRGVKNAWRRVTSLVLSGVRDRPVRRVDRSLKKAAELLEQKGYGLMGPTRRAPSAARRRTKQEYGKWTKLDEYLLATDDLSPRERNESIAEAFSRHGVTAHEVRLARKAGKLRRPR